ncbi:Trp biosynthesis-associated membrane protein [Paraoerskovia marina]|uniref:Trp biosynthesis-associated membrane protein n=1 Tax=Paraoerskovia marina TaxID=545619 RepID=UPI0005B9E2C4|nr:Trp biosynthesis-associated membrane protein [Paraoerskovia marina]
MRASLSRRNAVVALLLLGASALLLSMPVWMTAQGSSALEDVVDLGVAGTTAAPAVSAGALVLVASALALGLVGRVGRWVVLVVAAGSGLTILVGALNVALDPLPAMTAEAARATGVGEVTTAVDLTPFPWVVVVLGAIVLVVVLAAAWSARGWTTSGARHERGAPRQDVPDDDPAALWDELTRSAESDGPPAGRPDER